jgi:predicted Zn-dependent peptidase
VIRAVAAALALALPSAALAAFEVEVIEAGPDQPRLVLARRPGEVATLAVVFSAGGVDDGARSGLTRLAQRALLEANRKLAWEPFVIALHAAHAELEVDTGLRECAFTLTAHRKDFGALARQLAEALLAPRFDPALLPRALARALHDGREPGHGTGLLTEVASTAIDDARYKNQPLGDREQLEMFGADEVAAHLRGPLAPARATVVATGAYDRDELLRLLRRYRGGAAAAPERPALSVPVAARFRSAREAHVMAFPVRLAGAREAAGLRVLAGLVEQELWRGFRRMGVAYSFTVAPVVSPWLDLLLVVLPAQDGSAIALDGALREAVERVRAGGFDDETLGREKAAALAALRAADADPPALAAALAAGGPGWHGAPVAAALEGLDRAAVQQLAKAWLDPGRAVSLDFSPRPKEAR